MRDSVVVDIRGNVYNWLSYGLCFLVRNSVVLAVYLLFLVSSSLPYMSIIFGDETQRGGIAMKSLESQHIGLTRGDYCDSL